MLWTDKSTFSTSGFGSCHWVTHKAFEGYHEDSIDTTHESGRETKMIWEAFCGTLKSNLVFVPSKVNIDSSLCVKNIMEPHLVPFWHECCEEYGWVGVVEDGTPGHTGFANQ